MFQSTEEPHAPPSRRIRVGFLIIGLTLAVVLVAVTLSAWLGARELADAVTRGQAAQILDALGDIAHPGYGDDPDTDELAAQIEALAPELGVRYAGILYTDVGPGPRYGEPLRELSLRELRETVRSGLAYDGELARVAIPLGPEVFGPRPDRPPPPDHELDDRPPPARRPGPRGHLVVEFEPLLAAELEGRALRELAVGVTGAAIMILASLVFWRLSAAAERAEQRHAQQRQLAALGEMSAVLAHELRNPLASLKGHAQLLQERLDREAAPARTRTKAARVVAEAQRLEQLTSGLLSFVRVGEIVRQPASPMAIVEAAIADFAGARVEVDAEGAPASWPLDGQRIQQVITNLVDNALQAAPDERVRVVIRARGRACVVEVCDRGPGIPVDQRERIFAPFHTTRTRGTGLGLAVSRRIVDLHRGTIEIDDNPGGGAIVRVTIPQESP